MDLAELVATMRARGGELPGVEVKSAVGGLPDSVTATISAFANLPGGGLLLLGLDEDAGFVPVRLADPVGLGAALASRSRQAFDPPVLVSVDVEQFEGADVVVARVHELPPSAKPCVVKRTGRSYLRFADGDYEPSRLEIDGFVANRTRPRADEPPVPEADRSDLDPGQVADFLVNARATDRRLGRIADDDELLRRVGVLTASGVPTVAGLLALGEYPQQFLPHYNIRAALLPDEGTTSIRALDTATFTGPLAVILEDTVAWVARNSRRRLVTDAARGRVRQVLDPPAIAVRELVANALVHRDLGEWATSRAVELRITPATMRITNPGGLYGISADRLGVHPLTSARNRRLVEISKFLRTSDGNVVEALASGIPATLAALDDAAMAAPEFFDQAIAFTVIIHRDPEPTPTRDRRAMRTSGATDQILEALKAAMTVAELAAVLDVSENAVRKRLTRLRAEGRVILQGGRGRRTTYQRTMPTTT